MTALANEIPIDDIAAFCRRWSIVELALFGSAARGELRPESDIDVLVTFAPEAGWSMFDLSRARRELEQLLNRSVDMVERPALQTHHNPWLRSAILQDARVIYTAA
jgi:predicted nucleotidyltransferase